jgi:hypothetical protein
VLSVNRMRLVKSGSSDKLIRDAERLAPLAIVTL